MDRTEAGTSQVGTPDRVAVGKEGAGRSVERRGPEGSAMLGGPRGPRPRRLLYHPLSSPLGLRGLASLEGTGKGYKGKIKSHTHVGILGSSSPTKVRDS